MVLLIRDLLLTIPHTSYLPLLTLSSAVTPSHSACHPTNTCQSVHSSGRSLDRSPTAAAASGPPQTPLLPLGAPPQCTLNPSPQSAVNPQSPPVPGFPAASFSEPCAFGPLFPAIPRIVKVDFPLMRHRFPQPARVASALHGFSTSAASIPHAPKQFVQSFCRGALLPPHRKGFLVVKREKLPCGVARVLLSVELSSRRRRGTRDLVFEGLRSWQTGRRLQSCDQSSSCAFVFTSDFLPPLASSRESGGPTQSATQP
ncbi:hypothetical protein PGT21_034394 [Puccinia graminis f. sp. tritici]|uniref:Uncharacterized protein n=1 Tax=Puccinia graminis f. sp. tritici TaxID=56615 RepID=A0A5B0N993_PUCGR|nr:hypothetical protein PGT21_034394 [Puccinia graminis f. sp. tritici]